MGLLTEMSASSGSPGNELEATAVPSPAGKAVGQVQAAKQAVRERVWEQLERSGAALPPGAYGRIPMFERADAAADRLTRLPEWQAARIVTANPDRAQMPVRTRALAAGKIVYMAVPRLAGEYPSGTRFSSETADVLVARLGSRRSRPAGPGRAGGCPGTPARQRDRLRPPGPAG